MEKLDLRLAAAADFVKEGTVVLKPGQSITDSNGVTYTNPPVEEGEKGKTLEITMKDQFSGVKVKLYYTAFESLNVITINTMNCHTTIY